ncbi:hypothetical protein BJP36_36080 [Moorena producens JHB]|uniref:Uncharacterized protein n=1 Tax=Moorena producens (strain JHB) TaxID=1454205 RepID=A0A9Q9UW53_MOOP1|nr:hypothetical protein [Moorena producens]WAN69514.1 hypothetical protein BJP36_36080 [Moorena producens JHB]
MGNDFHCVEWASCRLLAFGGMGILPVINIFALIPDSPLPFLNRKPQLGATGVVGY